MLRSTVSGGFTGRTNSLEYVRTWISWTMLRSTYSEQSFTGWTNIYIVWSTYVPYHCIVRIPYYVLSTDHIGYCTVLLGTIRWASQNGTSVPFWPLNSWYQDWNGTVLAVEYGLHSSDVWSGSMVLDSCTDLLHFFCPIPYMLVGREYIVFSQLYLHFFHSIAFLPSKKPRRMTYIDFEHRT